MAALDRIASGPLQSPRTDAAKATVRSALAGPLTRQMGAPISPRAQANDDESGPEQTDEAPHAEAPATADRDAARVTPRSTADAERNDDRDAPQRSHAARAERAALDDDGTKEAAPAPPRVVPRVEGQQRGADERRSDLRNEPRRALRAEDGAREGRLFAAPMAPRELPRVEPKTASPLVLRERVVQQIERVERTIVERVATPIVAAPTKFVGASEALPAPGRSVATRGPGDEPKVDHNRPVRPAAEPRDAQRGALAEAAQPPNESYAARLQRAEEELRARNAQGPVEAPRRAAPARAEAASKAAAVPSSAAEKKPADGRVRDKIEPRPKAQGPIDAKAKPAPTVAPKPAPQPSLTPRAERRPAASAQPKPATPSIKISIGRVEVQTKSAPRAPEASVVWPRAHGIDPGLPFGQSSSGRF